MKSSGHIRFPRFLYVMKSLNELTPSRIASGIPSSTYGVWFRMKWKPKSRTDWRPISSRWRATAWGKVSRARSSHSTKPTRVVRPAWAAAIGPPCQSSYSGPRWTWQSIAPGKTSLPLTSISRAAEGSVASGPIAAIFSPWIAMLAGKASVAVTTVPPRRMRSQACWLMVAPTLPPGGRRVKQAMIAAREQPRPRAPNRDRSPGDGAAPPAVRHLGTQPGSDQGGPRRHLAARPGRPPLGHRRHVPGRVGRRARRPTAAAGRQPRLRRHDRPPVRLRVRLHLLGAHLHHGVARRAVCLPVAVRRGRRGALLPAGRAAHAAQGARPRRRLRGAGPRVRRRAAPAVATRADRGRAGARRRHPVGRDHAGHQGPRPLGHAPRHALLSACRLGGAAARAGGRDGGGWSRPAHSPRADGARLPERGHRLRDLPRVVLAPGALPGGRDGRLHLLDAALRPRRRRAAAR